MHLVSHRCLSACLSLSHLCLYLVRLLLVCLSSRSLVSPTLHVFLSLFSLTFSVPFTVFHALSAACSSSSCLPLLCDPLVNCLLQSRRCLPLDVKPLLRVVDPNKHPCRQTISTSCNLLLCCSRIVLAAQLLLFSFSSAMPRSCSVFALNRYVFVGGIVVWTCIVHCIGHCIAHCIAHRIAHCIAHCIVHCIVHRIVHRTVRCIVHCMCWLSTCNCVHYVCWLLTRNGPPTREWWRHAVVDFRY